MKYSEQDINRILERNHAPVRLDTLSAHSFLGNLKQHQAFICLLNGCSFSRPLGTVLNIIKGETKEHICLECKPAKYFRESWARFICSQLVGKQFPKRRPDFLRPHSKARPLELDGFCEELKHAFEYQGAQHYEPFGNITPQDVNNIQERDEIKKNLCLQHGIKLIIIEHSNDPKEIERQIKDYLKSFNVTLFVTEPDWTKYVMEGKPTSEEKARLHSQLKGYELIEPSHITNSDKDFTFRCNVNKKHQLINAKNIKAGVRPACKDCGHERRAEKTKITYTPDQLLDAGLSCVPKMQFQGWAGSNQNGDHLYKCLNLECNYVWAYPAKVILNGGQNNENVCMNCKQYAKPRVQFWQVQKKAFELGGVCEYAADITKETEITLKCHNALHESFKLTVMQFLGSDMWCDESPCNSRKAKIGLIKSKQVKEEVERNYEGLRFLTQPLDGQNSLIHLCCKKCTSEIKETTYKKLKNKKKKLSCNVCDHDLGIGWA